METYNRWPFVTGFFHLPSFSAFVHVVACISTSFLLWLNNIPLYGSISGLPIHQLMNFWVISTFLATVNNGATNLPTQTFVVDICFHFSWVDTQERNCWAMRQLSMFNFLRNGQTVFLKWLHSFTFSPATCDGSNFSRSS